MKILQRLRIRAELEEVQCLAEIVLEESMEVKELQDELIEMYERGLDNLELIVVIKDLETTLTYKKSELFRHKTRLQELIDKLNLKFDIDKICKYKED